MCLGQTVFDTVLDKRQEASIFRGNCLQLLCPTQSSLCFSTLLHPICPWSERGTPQMESKSRPLAQTIADSSNRKNGLEGFINPRILKEPIKDSFLEDLSKRWAHFSCIFVLWIARQQRVPSLFEGPEWFGRASQGTKGMPFANANQHFEMKSKARVQEQGAGLLSQG